MGVRLEPDVPRSHKHSRTDSDRIRGVPATRHGFSLIELVIVLVIVSVVGAIAGPRFATAAAQNRARAAADRVAADLELAQARARASSADVSVSFNVATESYKIGTGSEATTVDLSRPPYSTQIDQAIFTGGSAVRFNAFGVPDSSGSILISGGGLSFDISVAAETGEVTVQ